MPKVNQPGAEAETFITLLCVACDDEVIYHTLEKILSLPDVHRKAVLLALLRDMYMEQAPQDFAAAIECLLDDAVAEKAYETIFKCQRGITF